MFWYSCQKGRKSSFLVKKKFCKAHKMFFYLFCTKRNCGFSYTDASLSQLQIQTSKLWYFLYIFASTWAATRESTRNSGFSGWGGWGEGNLVPLLRRLYLNRNMFKYSNTMACLDPISKLNTQTKSTMKLSQNTNINVLEIIWNYDRNTLWIIWWTFSSPLKLSFGWRVRMVRIQPPLGDWRSDIYKSYVIWNLYNINVIYCFDNDSYHQKLENKVTQVRSAVFVFCSFLISSAYIGV